MIRQLRFHTGVVADISEALAWYDARSPYLADRFRAATNARFDDISSNAEQFPIAFDDADFRFARLRQFPYLVLFQIRNEIVHIVGVFHSASDPAKWRRQGN